MLTEQHIKSMNLAMLRYVRLDLTEVIAIQEKTRRDLPNSPYLCPKLGQYWDDLFAVMAELRARGEK